MKDKEDSNFGFYAFVLLNIFFVLAILIVAFMLCFESASALEVRQPTSTIVKNNENWYGYSIPTRATNDGSLSSSVYINYSQAPATSSDNWVGIFTNRVEMGLRDIPSQVGLALSNTDTGGLSYKEYYNIPNVWSKTYTITRPIINSYLGFGFSPGASYNTDSEMLESGYGVNYSSKYSYDFDVIVNSESDYGIPTNLFQTLEFCTYNNILDDYYCVSYGSNYYTYELVYSTDNIQYYRFHIKFNNISDGYGFNYYALENNEYKYNMTGNNLYGVFKSVVSQNSYYENVSITFSEPYNIVLWTQDSSITCTTTCWTQADTDNNQRILNDSDYLWNNLTDFVNDFNYHGFSGIVSLTYNYLIDLLEDNDCPTLYVPVFTSGFNLPNACAFWNREDLSTFKSLWDMVWLGLLSYYICWRIFKDILRIYDPSTSVIEGNEVADL